MRDIIKGQNSFSKKLLSSKKPIIIIGETALELKSGAYIFEELKEFLRENNLINDNWNAFNILAKNASTVGAIDLKFFNIKENNNFIFFDKLKNNEFELIYLLGSDNLRFNKNDTFKLISCESIEKSDNNPQYYDEGSLVDLLEKTGIGRPSTYAPTISTIQNRGYIEKGTVEGNSRDYLQISLIENSIQEKSLTRH